MWVDPVDAVQVGVDCCVIVVDELQLAMAAQKADTECEQDEAALGHVWSGPGL